MVGGFQQMMYRSGFTALRHQAGAETPRRKTLIGAHVDARNPTLVLRSDAQMTVTDALPGTIRQTP